jgi:hypothetical protein
LYKLQVCNALTQEILREKTYQEPDLIFSLIESAEKGQECFLFDEERRTLKGAYVSHMVSIENNITVYKVLFKVKLAEVQARIGKWSYKKIS